MTSIFWGVMGEGLGHVTRTLAVVERLPGCEVHLFTSGSALDYLERIGYRHVHEIEGMTFQYKNARVAQFASMRSAVRFFWKSRARNVAQIVAEAHRLRPQLFLTDFEPSMALAAEKWGGTLISVDNQHRFSHCSVVDLPMGLRCYARLVGQYIRFALGRPKVAVVSTFCPEYLRPTQEGTVLVNAVIRSSVETLSPRDDGFVLAYVRDSIRDRVLACLERLDQPCIVYGASPSKSRRNIECKALAPDFVLDLARCSCVVATAGHQLISEACCLGKPILAIPEPGQYEQYVNAWQLEKIGCGWSCDLDRLSPRSVAQVAASVTPRPRRLAGGAAEVARIIQAELPLPSRLDVRTQAWQAVA